MRTVNPEKAEIRRKEILFAAKQCFEQKGFHGSSMAEICAKANISPGALYRYFPSKEAIIEAMSEEDSTRAIDSLEDAINDVKRGKDFNIALFEIMHEVINLFCNKSHGALATELMAEAMRNDSFAENICVGYMVYFDKFSSFMALGQESGKIDKNLNPKEIASLLMTLIDGMIIRTAFSPNLDKKEINSWITRMVLRYLDPNSTITETEIQKYLSQKD